MGSKVALDPYLLILLLFAGAFSFIAFLILPSVIEILRPRLREPRRIMRLPLQKIVRRKSKSPFVSSTESVANANASKNLQDFLKEGGVRHRYIGDNTVRIFTDVVFPCGSVVSENIVVEGALTAGDECVFHGSVKARRNVLIGCGVVIKGNLISEGDVDVRDESVIAGLVHAEGSVRLGEKVYVGLSVVANGDVELYENSEVKKNILSYGVIKTLKNPVLDFPPTVEDIG